MRYTGIKRPVRRIIVVFCRKVAEKVVKSSRILDVSLKVDSMNVADGLGV